MAVAMAICEARVDRLLVNFFAADADEAHDPVDGAVGLEGCG